MIINLIFLLIKNLPYKKLKKKKKNTITNEFNKVLITQ